MEQNSLEVTEQTEVFAFTSIRDLVNQTLHKNFGQDLPLNGLSTGFKALDKATGGLKKGQLITVAVRPGMGKTAFLLSVANNMAIKNNYSLAIFSAERSNQKMTNRIIESETGMSLDKLQYGPLKASEKDHMHSLLSSIARANIFFDDTPTLTVQELAQRCRQLKFVHNIDLVIIDYLELLTTHISDPDSRSEQLSNIVKQIKDIASELNLPVLLFSQMPNSFPGFVLAKRPELKELPVFISELSDLVMFLHRGGLSKTNGHLTGKSDVELVIAKHTDSSKQVIVPLSFIESISKFVDLS
jgi:replicative DNA helicase